MKKLRNAPRHKFLFLIETGTGEKPRFLEAKAKVKRAKKPVDLWLTADHVRRSIAAKGTGNTATCAGAFCAKDGAAKFPHSVEGYIDWQYTKAYVVSKLNEYGFPSECYVYDHSDTTARLFDTKVGQAKLLARLDKHGPHLIHLRPIVLRERIATDRLHRRTDASRSLRPNGVGAKLRYAVAHAGGVTA